MGVDVYLARGTDGEGVYVVSRGVCVRIYRQQMISTTSPLAVITRTNDVCRNAMCSILSGRGFIIEDFHHQPAL